MTATVSLPLYGHKGHLFKLVVGTAGAPSHYGPGKPMSYLDRLETLSSLFFALSTSSVRFYIMRSPAALAWRPSAFSSWFQGYIAQDR